MEQFDTENYLKSKIEIHKFCNFLINIDQSVNDIVVSGFNIGKTEFSKNILKTLKSKNIKKVKDVLIFMIDENDDIFIQRKKE